MNTVIKIENLSKTYQLGQIGTGTLSHDLNRWWHKLRGMEDPYTKLAEINDRTKRSESGYVNVLKGINLDVNQGEVLGVIGKNGAGKSTLLKILSKVTGPTSGSIKSKGRIASLLEVGTGFHPELTGRENIYMNGTIMGMTKREIDSKLDEIVEFSGVAKYLDTPTKRYSSGMTVRLGFAIAAYLEPEILIVDEVLAVGDADFQKKAIGKMKDVTEEQGRTILFVSHNMAAIKSLCTRCVVLENGTISYSGPTLEAIQYYLNMNEVIQCRNPYVNDNVSQIGLSSLRIKNGLGADNQKFSAGDEINLELTVNNVVRMNGLEARITIFREGIHIASMSSGLMNNFYLDNETNIINVKIDSTPLIMGDYKVSVALHKAYIEIYESLDDIMSFSVSSHDINNTGFNYSSIWNPIVYLPNRWNTLND